MGAISILLSWRVRRSSSLWFLRSFAFHEKIRRELSVYVLVVVLSIKKIGWYPPFFPNRNSRMHFFPIGVLSKTFFPDGYCSRNKKFQNLINSILSRPAGDVWGDKNGILWKSTVILPLSHFTDVTWTFNWFVFYTILHRNHNITL